MARHGRNLTAKEKRSISELTSGKVRPTEYLVIKELARDSSTRTLHLRHKSTGEEFDVTIPK